MGDIRAEDELYLYRKSRWDRFVRSARTVVSVLIFAWAIYAFIDETYAKCVSLLLAIMVLENVDDRRLRRERHTPKT